MLMDCLSGSWWHCKVFRRVSGLSHFQFALIRVCSTLGAINFIIPVCNMCDPSMTMHSLRVHVWLFSCTAFLLLLLSHPGLSCISLQL